MCIRERSVCFTMIENDVQRGVVRGSAAYALLGLEEWTKAKTPPSEEDVRRAFRRKAREHHPDKAGGSAREFARLKSAVDYVLRDVAAAAERAQGMENRAWSSRGSGGGGGGGESLRQWQAKHMSRETAAHEKQRRAKEDRGEGGEEQARLAREAGNKLYSAGDLDGALLRYSEALVWCPRDAKTLANRSAVLLKMGRLKVRLPSLSLHYKTRDRECICAVRYVHVFSLSLSLSLSL